MIDGLPHIEYEDVGLEYRIICGTRSRCLYVVNRRNEIAASFQPWLADFAQETMDRLNIRRLAGRG